MKKLLSTMVMLAVLISPISAMAKPAPSVYVNNKLIKTDQAPIIRNGTTLLPVRAVFEGLGLKVNFNDTGAVYSKLGNSMLSINYKKHPEALDTHIVIDPDLDEVVDDYHYYNFNYPPVIVNNRSLVPVRFIAESLGLKVLWDKQKNAVYINGTLPNQFKIIPGGMKSTVSNTGGTEAENVFEIGGLTEGELAYLRSSAAAEALRRINEEYKLDPAFNNQKSDSNTDYDGMFTD